jgi:hypothetical protein
MTENSDNAEPEAPDDSDSSTSVGVETAFSDVPSEPRDPLAVSAPTQLLQVILNSLIAVHLLDGLMHVLLSAQILRYSSLYPQSLYRRSHGLFSLSLALLSIGIRRKLQGKLDISTVFVQSITLYCVASLSNLLFSVTFDRNADFPSAYMWLKLVFHTIWVVGLVYHERFGFGLRSFANSWG